MAFNIADLFEHTTDAVPARAALTCGERAVTFGDLDFRANRLAHHLRDHGEGEADHVAVYAPPPTEPASRKCRAGTLANVHYPTIEGIGSQGLWGACSGTGLAGCKI